MTTRLIFSSGFAALLVATLLYPTTIDQRQIYCCSFSDIDDADRTLTNDCQRWAFLWMGSLGSLGAIACEIADTRSKYKLLRILTMLLFSCSFIAAFTVARNLSRGWHSGFLYASLVLLALNVVTRLTSKLWMAAAVVWLMLLMALMQWADKRIKHLHPDLEHNWMECNPIPEAWMLHLIYGFLGISLAVLHVVGTV